MNEQRKIYTAFVKLGNFLGDFCNAADPENEWHTSFNEVISMAKHHNGWFTEENIHFALKGWSELLTEQKLSAWLSNYNLEENKTKTVALVMAGNIPLVGFHDFLSVLITGNKFLGKLASTDKALLPLLANYLIQIEPSLKDKIIFTEERLENFVAVIATGSNNTARYFEHYFSKGPNIIRRNRNSVAVLTGNETSEDLTALGEDIFRYYGLGCRSVSKLFVPEGYDFDSFFKALYVYNPLIQQAKYANNYDYNKAVYLMSEFKILENGFLMLKEDESYASPIASVFYETYSASEELKEKLKIDSSNIQCIVSKGFLENEIPFGKTQTPELTDYADGVDTVQFLLKT